MRRFLYVLLLLIICAPVFAGGVGYVNYDKVVENYQYAKTSLREIETKNNILFTSTHLYYIIKV